MKRIIVTGGAGYIGSHTVVELQSQGYEVVIIDNLCNSSIEVLDRIESISGVRPGFHQTDLLDLDQLKMDMSSYDHVTGIIHFAALKAVGESVQNPIQYYRNNVQGLINVLDVMNELSIKNIIFSSSATVYGQPENLPATEQTPLQPATSPYGATKQMGEQIIHDCTIAHSELNAIALRYFNPIGAHSSGKIGELPIGVPNNLMPFITQTAAGLRDELKIFGDDYNTIDGTAVRDYIHVVDLAKAHVKAIDRLVKGEHADAFEVFNLGTGNGYSVLEVVESFQKSTGVSLPYQIVARRPGDVEAIYASTDKANKVLGWTAELGLDDMTLSHWNWEKHIRGIM